MIGCRGEKAGGVAVHCQTGDPQSVTLTERPRAAASSGSVVTRLTIVTVSDVLTIEK